MDLFKDSVNELAQRLSENSELYNHAIAFLKDFKGLLSEQLDVTKNLSLIEQANNIARESDYYVFEVEDTWADQEGFQEQGYGVYQKTNDKLIGKLGMGDFGRPATLEETIDFLRKNRITQIFTTYVSPREGYCDLENSFDDNDGHSITYTSVDKDLTKYLKSEGIDITFLRQD